MLDASRKVTGAAEYDVFGFPNRVSLDKETAHPYANNSNLTLADFTQAIGGTANPSTQIQVRAIFDVVDTEGPVATPADYVFLKDPDGGVAMTSNIGGPHRGQVWSPWVIPSAGRVQVPFVSNATGNTYTGVVMAGYEYQRYQTGASPFWTPLGFPGQYHDAETDLFQNWNRFYNASTGRYLEADPLGTRPTTTLVWMHGASLPVYAYALNNPLSFSDETGRIPGWKDIVTGIMIGLKALWTGEPGVPPEPETPEQPYEPPGPRRPSTPGGGKPPGGPGGGGGGDPPLLPPGGGGSMCPVVMTNPPPDPCSPLNRLFHPGDDRPCIY